jgi:hypothetical protein
VSAKKHTLVPRNFVVENIMAREALGKFHRMTGEECRALQLAGTIEKIGPKIWRLREEFCSTASCTSTGAGLLSTEIGSRLRDVIRSAMASRAAP